MNKQVRRTLLKATYLKSAARMADPNCTECLGTGICGWGLRANRNCQWALPCIKCRHAEYVAAGEAMANKYGEAAKID